MSWINNITLKSRTARHILFWITWVLSFTFIKSFGAEMEVYAGWFLYYILTLPIFLLHTYMIVYWIGRRFIQGWSILVFIILFLTLLISFSYLELLLSHKVLAIYFPKIFTATGNYLSMANIVISGIGNLYIVLVFIAVKMIRKWYVTSEEKKKFNERLLEDKVARANVRIQPGMLLYAIGRMEEMADNNSENVSSAIAILSEVLNGAMLAGESSGHRIDEEHALLMKLLKLHSIFNNCQVPTIAIKGANLYKPALPALAVFSVTEILLRSIQVIFRLSIELMNSGFLFEARIRLDFDQEHFPVPDLVNVRDELNQLFPGKFELKSDTDKYHYTLSIREWSGRD